MVPTKNMRKRVLEQNILPTAKQRIVVQGLAAADILLISRDPIDMKLGVVALPDQSRVPGGRKRAGDFKVKLQFAHDLDRTAFVDWYEQGVDDGTPRGIDPNYKRDAIITYLRLFSGKQPVTALLLGCWLSNANLPNYEMNGDDAEGDTILEVTINFDDVDLQSGSEFASAIVSYAEKAALNALKNKAIKTVTNLAVDAAIALL